MEIRVNKKKYLQEKCDIEDKIVENRILRIYFD